MVIRNRNTNEIIAELCEANLSRADLSEANLRMANLRMANLREADLRWADLRGADLSGADLRGADLRGADLREADLSGADLLVLQLPIWTVYIIKDTIRIGCKYYTVTEWEMFTNEYIVNMDRQALEWWKIYKEVIMIAARTIK